jgi:hypothetical protein
MDDRVKRLIDLKESVKGYFEVTGVGVGGWEAGFDAVRHTNALAEAFVIDLRRLVSFIEAEFEYADETEPARTVPRGPRPPTTPVPRSAPPPPARPPVSAARPAVGRPVGGTTLPGRPSALARAATAYPTGAAPSRPAATTPPRSTTVPPSRRPASGAHAAAKAPQPPPEDYPADPTERVVLPERRTISPSGRHRRK